MHLYGYHFTVMPEIGNEGEDLTWVSWMIIGHNNPDAVLESVLGELCDQWKGTLNESDTYDRIHTNFQTWFYEVYDEDTVPELMFMEWLEQNHGYVTLPLAKVGWV